MLKVSANSTGIARNCWKKYYWNYVANLEPCFRPKALTLGSIMHEAFDMFYKGSPADDITSHITRRYDEVISMIEATDQEDFIIDRFTALGMWTNYPHKQLDEFTQVTSEESFKVKVNDNLEFIGKWDGRLLHKRTGMWLRELKITNMRQSQFISRIHVSPQCTGYVFAGKRLGHPIQGMMYDFIKKPLLRKGLSESMVQFGQRIYRDYRDRKHHYYFRHFEYRNPVQLDIYERDLFLLASDIAHRYGTGEWYRNPDHCWAFNSECPFMKICFEEPPDPLVLEMYYVDRKGGEINGRFAKDEEAGVE